MKRDVRSVGGRCLYRVSESKNGPFKKIRGTTSFKVKDLFERDWTDWCSLIGNLIKK